ncbi:MAG TPA: hypothetical protein PKC18_16345 [Lacipirellulaceae bacterium]|nr:hypothetical protein [Lacipirellulaceae bacterium]
MPRAVALRRWLRSRTCGARRSDRLTALCGVARGVTLVELVLVMALLVIAGSLAIPAITGAFASVKLRRAGDDVLTRWAQARAQAVETGVPYQFRFEPETGRYRVEPWSSIPGAATAATGESTSTGPPTPATIRALDETPTVESQLTEGIVFHGGQAAAVEPLSGERRVAALEASGDVWSTPILFFPDGTSSQASVVLASDLPQYLRLTLRGLTGTGRASSVLTRDEMTKGADTR